MSKNVQQPTKQYVLEEALEVALMEDMEEVLEVDPMEVVLGVDLVEEMEEVLIDGNHQAKDALTDGRGAPSFSRRVEVVEIKDMDIPRSHVEDLMDPTAEARSKLNNNVSKYHSNHAVLCPNKNAKRYPNSLAITHLNNNAPQ
jgi:hypothetical protein